MQHRIKNSSLLFLLTMLIAGGCNDNKKCVYYPLSSEVNSLLFKAGSYWIYEDSVSGEKDTLTITTIENRTKFSEGINSVYTKGCSTRESFISHVKSASSNTRYQDFYVSDQINRDQYAGDSVIYYGYYYDWESREPDTFRVLIGLYFVSRQSVMNFNGVDYSNVRVFKVKANEVYGSGIVFYNTNYYHSLNHGLIRYEVDSGNGAYSVWNLVYKSIQPYR